MFNILSAISVSAMFTCFLGMLTSTSPAFAGDGEIQIRVTVVSAGETIINSAQTSSIGRESSFVASTDMPYVKSINRHKDHHTAALDRISDDRAKYAKPRIGKDDVLPGILTSGTSVKVTPLSISKDGIVQASVEFDHKVFDKIIKFELPDFPGAVIELPQLSQKILNSAHEFKINKPYRTNIAGCIVNTTRDCENIDLIIEVTSNNEELIVI